MGYSATQASGGPAKAEGVGLPNLDILITIKIHANSEIPNGQGSANSGIRKRDVAGKA